MSGTLAWARVGEIGVEDHISFLPLSCIPLRSPLQVYGLVCGVSYSISIPPPWCITLYIHSSLWCPAASFCLVSRGGEDTQVAAAAADHTWHSRSRVTHRNKEKVMRSHTRIECTPEDIQKRREERKRDKYITPRPWVQDLTATSASLRKVNPTLRRKHLGIFSTGCL